jgi:hypothetical protein
MSNLFRVLGVQALNGLHPVPQLQLWSVHDLEGGFREACDRYAHIGFAPRAAALRRLGVTHVLGRADAPRALRHFSELESLGSVGKNHLYTVPPLNSA